MNKTDGKVLFYISMFILTFVLIAVYVPNDSIFKQYFAYFLLVVLLIASLFFTGVLNWIYRFFKKK